MILAITGGTGFVGGALIRQAVEAGHRVRALARRAQPERDGVVWIAGALDDPAALDRVVEGADAVVHVAGVVNAPDRAGFVAGNVEGTRAILAAAGRAGSPRFVHVSSLAAREPGLSNYGWSKAEAERLVSASALPWTMVRPPGIYGPGDMDQLDLFRIARYGLAFLPPPGRLSLIAVDDLARLLLALAAAEPVRTIYEADDGSAGWTYDGFARAIGAAVGRRVMPMHLPQGLLSIIARGDRWWRGDKARLTADRVAYFCHPDWTIDPNRRPPPSIWVPSIPTMAGLADTARWYRHAGLL
ncbi:epimerase [Sphingomonas sp. Leaf339]|uniref:SDR family oxidoreductase n=1 Tax=Sphingomonas sp. Leaf339 TaxID=1736343 RepID=UPI0006FF6A6E|nr:NAD(P)H-binding protein [Sphingomonas sp. Leaf339]KQU49715.1 epimerase [Sphingomonas sp. Leaf339]